MTTEAAQRRLLEALATMHHTPGQDVGAAGDPLGAFATGVAFARGMAEGADQAPLVAVYVALEDLIDSVRTDLIGALND